MNAIAEILDKHCGTVNGNMTGERDVLPALERQLASVRGHTASLFPIEQGEKRSCMAEEERLNKEIRRLRLRQFLFERQCPVLAPEALKLRNDKGLPQVALFTLDCSESSFTYYSARGRLTMGPLELPENYLEVYDDISSKMAEVVAGKLRRSKRLAWSLSLFGFLAFAFAIGGYSYDKYEGVLAIVSTLSGCVLVLSSLFRFETIREGEFLCHSVTWSGLIPPKARQLIAEMKALGAPVFLLAEVEEWETVIKRDPLILTADGKQFYIVDSFETTGLEEHLKLEWSEAAKA